MHDADRQRTCHEIYSFGKVEVYQVSTKVSPGSNVVDKLEVIYVTFIVFNP